MNPFLKTGDCSTYRRRVAASQSILGWMLSQNRAFEQNDHDEAIRQVIGSVAEMVTTWAQCAEG